MHIPHIHSSNMSRVFLSHAVGRWSLLRDIQWASMLVTLRHTEEDARGRRCRLLETFRMQNGRQLSVPVDG